MQAFVLESLLATSLAINIFVAMYCFMIFVLDISIGKFSDRLSFALLRLHDERPWYLPRYIVLSLGNVALFLSGIVMLCATSVVQAPFRDFPRSVQICFAIMVGFYIFKALLDTVHYNHFTAYGIHTVHHLLTITLYMVFLIERQNGLCGVLGLVFQADAVFIDTSKLLSGMDKDENEFVNFTWINKYTGATVTFSTRLVLPATLIFISFTKNSIFTMDLIVVMFYFLSLVFFTIWNLLMFRTAVMGCVRYSHRVKTMTFQRAIEGPTDAVYRQPDNQTSSRLRVKHNDFRRLAPCSNTNIATTRKQSNRLNNQKNPQKIPISDAIGQLQTGEPSQSRHIVDRVRWSRGRSIPVDGRSSSEYDPPSTISDVDENAVRLDEKYPHRLDTISWSTSENSGDHFLTDTGQGVTSENHVVDAGQAVIYNTITDNVYYRHPIPPPMYNSYVQLNGNVYLERREDGSPGPSDSAAYRHSDGHANSESHQRDKAKVTQQRQRHTDVVGLSASEARLTAQLAYTDNTTTEVRSPCSKTVLEGTYLPNSIQRIHIPDMSAYPQFGENQSI